MQRVSNAGWWVIGGIFVLLVVLGITALGWPDPSKPYEDLCPQGAVLRQARLLDRAQTIYAKAATEGDDCQPRSPKPKSPLEKVEAGLRRSGELFTSASARRGAGETVAAIEDYFAGLKANPFELGAKLGLAAELKAAGSKTAPADARLDGAGFCTLASELVDAGLLAAAQTSLSSAREQVPGSCQAPLASLSKQSAQATELLHSGKRLDDEGKTSDARERYAEALLKDSDLGDARTALEGSIDEQSRLDAVTSWLSGVPPTLKDWLSWLVPLAIGLLLVAFGLWMAIRELSARVVWARHLFEWLGGHRGWSFVYHAAVPEVEVKPFEGGGDGEVGGKDFSNLLSAALSEEVGREPAFPFDRATDGTKEDTRFSTTAAAALEAVPATKLLGSLIKILSKLFRRRSIILSGRLVAATDQGVGVLLTLEGNGREIGANMTLWEKAFDPLPGGEASKSWPRLAPAATVWARWQLGAAHAKPKPTKIERWLPDALFQTALAWQTSHDYGRAQALYAKALEEDPMLLPAVHNLAVIELRERDYAQARERLLELRKELAQMREDKTRSDRGELWPTLGTSSLYTLILATAYPEIVEGAKPNAEATQLATELVGKLACLVESEDDPHLSKADFKELEAAESPSVVLLASLLVRERPGLRAKAVAEAIAKGKGVAPVTRANLCSKSTLASLAPWQLVHGYAERQPNVSRRTQYNLACYFTTLGGYARCGDRKSCFELALTALKAALVGEELREWADHDPSLQPLKEDDEKKFKEVLEAHAIKAHPSGEDKPADATDAAAAEKKPDKGGGSSLLDRAKELFAWLGGLLGL